MGKESSIRGIGQILIKFSREDSDTDSSNDSDSSISGMIQTFVFQVRNKCNCFCYREVCIFTFALLYK
jgi:hypothetical protein